MRLSTTRLRTAFVVLFLAVVAILNGCALLAPTPVVTHHHDNLVVMSLPNRASGLGVRGMARICREFYRHYEDSFDIIAIVPNHSGATMSNFGSGTLAVMATVRNAVSGTGLSAYDSGARFGSSARLKGVMQINSVFALFGPGLHEIMHLWVGGETEVIPTAIKGHWGFSSVHGRLGGFDPNLLVSLGDDKYSAGEFSPQGATEAFSLPYSALELYLAGWLAPDEVSEIQVAEDALWSLGELSEKQLKDCRISYGPLKGKLGPPCAIETDSQGHKVFKASKISTWTIDKIIERLGPREPSYQNSQKAFRMAVIVVVDKDQPIPSVDTVMDSMFIEQFTAQHSVPDSFKQLLAEIDFREEIINFWEATGGRASLQSDALQSFRR